MYKEEKMKIYISAALTKLEDFFNNHSDKFEYETAVSTKMTKRYPIQLSRENGNISLKVIF